jgi:hypothetical protein
VLAAPKPTSSSSTISTFGAHTAATPHPSWVRSAQLGRKSPCERCAPAELAQQTEPSERTSRTITRSPKPVIVTVAGSRIGRAAAVRFASEEARVPRGLIWPMDVSTPYLNDYPDLTC